MFFPQKKLSDFATNGSKTTPLFLKEKGSAECGGYGYVRMGTENYGVSAPPHTACVCTTKTLRFSLKVKGGLGESENLLFP